jgi:hypothetical protein
MYNHLNLKILIHIFAIIYLIMIIIKVRGEGFAAHLDGLGCTLVCRGTPVAHHWSTRYKCCRIRLFLYQTNHPVTFTICRKNYTNHIERSRGHSVNIEISARTPAILTKI